MFPRPGFSKILSCFKIETPLIQGYPPLCNKKNWINSEQSSMQSHPVYSLSWKSRLTRTNEKQMILQTISANLATPQHVQISTFYYMCAHRKGTHNMADHSRNLQNFKYFVQFCKYIGYSFLLHNNFLAVTKNYVTSETVP